jgi:hypothetical protein
MNVLLVSSFGLVACSPSDSTVEFIGPDHGYGWSCAELARNGFLRAESGTPSRVWVTGVDWSQSGYVYTFTGITNSNTNGGTARYEWTCAAEESTDFREVEIVLTEFTRIE